MAKMFFSVVSLANLVKEGGVLLTNTWLLLELESESEAIANVVVGTTTTTTMAS
jgi:hypothetical protein